jgi:hypothetical protein
MDADDTDQIKTIFELEIGSASLVKSSISSIIILTARVFLMMEASSLGSPYRSHNHLMLLFIRLIVASVRTWRGCNWVTKY